MTENEINRVLTDMCAENDIPQSTVEEPKPEAKLADETPDKPTLTPITSFKNDLIDIIGGTLDTVEYVCSRFDIPQEKVIAFCVDNVLPVIRTAVEHGISKALYGGENSNA